MIMDMPCKDCISFPVCVKYLLDDEEKGIYWFYYTLSLKCDIVTDYYVSIWGDIVSSSFKVNQQRDTLMKKVFKEIMNEKIELK